MRRSYLVCYDIRDPKRLRRVHKVMKSYGESWQFSVFYCVLKEIDRVRLQSSLEREMNLKEDRALIVDLGADESSAREAATTLGQPPPEPDEGMLVI